MTGYPVYSEQTAIPSILLSGAELTEYYSVHSGIRIGPKRTQLLPFPCILIPVPEERALILDCAFVVEAAFNIGKCVHLSCFLFAQNHSLIKPRPNLGTSPIS